MTAITKAKLRDMIAAEPTLSCRSMHSRTAYHRVRNVLSGESITVRTGGRPGKDTLQEVWAAIDGLRTGDHEALEIFEEKRVKTAAELREAREGLIAVLEDAEHHFEDDLRTLGSICYRGLANTVAVKANLLTSLRATCRTLRERTLCEVSAP